MNSNEEGNNQIDLPEWYNPYYIVYRQEDAIDFFKVYDDFNQTKIKLFTLEICTRGWHFAISKSMIKIIRLQYIYNDRDSSEQELIRKAIQKLKEEVEQYEERKAETVAAIEETKAKFLSLQNEYKLQMEPLKHLLAHEPEKRMKLFFKSNSPCHPFNDPYNEFGWKDICDLKNPIRMEYKKRIADAKSDEELTRLRLFGHVGTEGLPVSYIEKEWVQDVKGELILERDYKVNEAFLGFCKKYFQEDLSQPIYDGLAFFSD